MKSSGIGGQAVMEGVMMKNKDAYAVAVRKPDQEIELLKEDYKSIIRYETLTKIPFVRGVFNFVDSMALGMKALNFSARFYEEEEAGERDGNKDSVLTGLVMVGSIVLAVAIFMVLPYFISLFFRRFVSSGTLIAAIEGGIRLGIFVGYVVLISLMQDIRRVFMYHGAEHKCINCIEHGLALTVENVKKSSRQHKRCGTSFLLIVMVVSILFFMFIRLESPVLRLVARLLLIPVIAGVSYEFIRLAGNSDSWIVNFLSKPGMWLQNLTTREPTEDMIEVGIASVEAVFDWRAYLEEHFSGKTGQGASGDECCRGGDVKG